jgi:Peptidase family S41
MSIRLLLSVLLLTALSPVAQEPTALTRELTFEGDQTTGTPAGWTAPAGVAFADAEVVHGGRGSVRIERQPGAQGEFSGILKAIPLDVAGQTVELRGFLRTKNVNGSVALWLREDGDRPNLAFDTTQNRQVSGTNDWQEHRVSVPIKPEGRQLFFGVLVAGSGTVWADDLELLVDGKPIAEAPRAVRPKTVLDTDTEFDRGSTITLDRVSPIQIQNLTTLGRVWGFLKYHHPLITSGGRHWDYELFRILPSVLAATDRATANAVLVKWIAGLGPVKPCQPCAALKTADLDVTPDLAWLDDESALGTDLRSALKTIYANRPAGGSQFYVSLTPNIGNPSFDHEPAYARVALPDAGFQLLGLYRFWNIVQYWYPNREIVGEHWSGVLGDTVAGIALAKTPADYKRQLLALIARVHDTHANLWSSLDARPPVGACQLPVTLRFIEDRPVVVDGGAGLERGDVVTTLDGAAVSQLVREWSPYFAASNDPTRLRDIARSMTRGACSTVSVGVERLGKPMTLEATRVTPQRQTAPVTHDQPGDTFRKLADGTVAYLKLSSIKTADVPGYLEAAAATKGLVIDIRNYPSDFVVFTLGNALARDSVPFARFTNADLGNPGAFVWGPTLSLTPKAPRYTGKVVVLVDEISQSQAEYTSMAFRAAGATIVGSTTAGADGNVSAIPLPGGLSSMISGLGVFYPDKRPTQRVGIVPDVEVRPTIEGIRLGKDEVLDAAVRLILK